MITNFRQLSPVELSYFSPRIQELKKNSLETSFGLKWEGLNGLLQSQDLTVLGKTAIFLTTFQGLSSIFHSPEDISTLQKNQEEDSVVKTGPWRFASYNSLPILERNNKIIIGSNPNTTTSTLTLVPLGDKVTLFNNGKQLFVNGIYPFEVSTRDGAYSEFSFYKQRLWVSFSVETSVGERFLTFTPDFILRAVGCKLNNTIFNDPLFRFSERTNTWPIDLLPEKQRTATYYLSLEDPSQNATTQWKKQMDIQDNFLVFVDLETKKVNVLSLRAHQTSTNKPLSIDNT